MYANVKQNKLINLFMINIEKHGITKGRKTRLGQTQNVGMNCGETELRKFRFPSIG